MGIDTVARFAFPWLLHHVMAARSRELFLLTSPLVALGTAHIAGRAGQSWPNPRADFAFGPDDRLVLTGEGAQLRAAELLLREGVAPEQGPPARAQPPPALDGGGAGVALSMLSASFSSPR